VQIDDTLSPGRRALLALQIGAVLVVLAALPYPLFQLDRYTFVKELVLIAAALAAVLSCLAAARGLTVFMADALVSGFLALSLISALFADNPWLAFRACGVSLAGAALFWSARSVTLAGHGQRLLIALAVSVVIGSSTGLIQAYGLVTSELASTARAPGGTFGNRNFMAHMAAIGLPVLVMVTLQARRRRGFALGTAGIALTAAALVLSRSRAAWLGAVASAAFLAVEGLWIGRLWADEQLRRRVLTLGATAWIGLVFALVLPNQLNWRSESPYLDSLAGMANYKEGSGRGRLIQYGNTLEMALDHPVLGVGPGNWPVHYPTYKSPGDPSFDADDPIPTNPWPSSDWMALLSERGLPASLLLLLVGGSIALAAWIRIRRRARRPPGLTDLTIVSTLIALVVVGAFDAVLLLPAPAYFVWATLGVLVASAQPIRELTLTPPLKRRMTLVVAIVGALLLTQSILQVAGMALASGEKRDRMEIAAGLDPGSYRIRMLLAQRWRAAGRCDKARPHAQAASALFPNHPAPRAILRSCGRGR
jgi:O-antigen ligase